MMTPSNVPRLLSFFFLSSSLPPLLHPKSRHTHPTILNENIRKGGLRTESGDLLAVLDKLDTDALPDSGVGLLGLDTDLLEDDALGVGGTTEGRGLEGGTEGALLVGQVRPLLVLPVKAQLTGRVETTGLSFTHDCWRGEGEC